MENQNQHNVNQLTILQQNASLIKHIENHILEITERVIKYS